MLKELKRIENIIITIGELDDSSFTFRYLTDKEGEYIFSNNEIINLFKQMKETNTDVEKYMDEFIKKWYDSNVGVFGRRKKDN